VRTTVSINDAILSELRRSAAREGIPFSRYLEKTLQTGLSAKKSPGAKTVFKVRSHPLQLKAGYRGLSLNQIYDQIEAEDALR
jgi:hypothetical protein